jgi:hypothetical protein
MISRRNLLISACLSAVGPIASAIGQQHKQELEDPARVPVRRAAEARRFSPGHQDIRDNIAFDRYGLIIQRDRNGGDTAAREGMYWLARKARENFFNKANRPSLAPFQAWRTREDFIQVLDHLEEKDASGNFTGRYRRHPFDTTGGYNTPEKMSRDNMLPLIAAMGAWDMNERLDRFVRHLDKKLWVFNAINNDLLYFYQQFIKRARNQAVDETIDKGIADCAVSARLRCIKDIDDVGDDLNTMVSLLLPELRQTKDYFKAIRLRYVNLRPVNYGVYLTAYYRHWGSKPVSIQLMNQRVEEGRTKLKWTPDCSNAFGALKWYCRVESAGNPGLADLYKPLYDMFFGAPPPPAGKPFEKVNDVKECTIFNLVPESLCGLEKP